MSEPFIEAFFNIAALLFVFVALGFCIFIHEFGHFLAAKLCGLHVDAFALGFRPFWRRTYGGVEYRLGYLPFGGYCEIPQVDASDDIPKTADGRELPRAKPLERIATAVAGPLFNILGGLLIACFVWYFGMPQESPKMRELTVLAIDPAGPEYEAGLRPGDRIVKLNGEDFFTTWSQFAAKLLFSIDKVELDVVRGGQNLKFRYQPRVNPNAPGSLGKEGVAWPFFMVLIPVELTPLPGGAAEAAGIRRGDVVLSFNSDLIADYDAFVDSVTYGKGAPVRLTLKRRGEAQPVEVTVTPRPLPVDTARPRYRCGILMRQIGNDIIIEKVLPDSPAAKAGLRSGDMLLAANGKKLTAPDECSAAIEKDRGVKASKLTVRRDDREMVFSVTAETLLPYGIGVRFEHSDHPAPWQLFTTTVRQSWFAVRGITTNIGNKLGWTDKQSSLKPSHMSGPLGIGTVLFTSVKKSSLMTGIYFMAMISFALAIFNLLPFPVLDGGHILFGLIELIFRKPLPRGILKVLTAIFITLLIMLMLYVTFADGRRLYRMFSDDDDRTAGETVHDDAP